MSWLKKNVDYVSMGTQQMSDDADLEQTQEQKKQAIKRYLADTSGLLAHEHNLSLLDYLSGNNALTGTYTAWEKLYHHSRQDTDYQALIGNMIDDNVLEVDSQYYPVIPLKYGGREMWAEYERNPTQLPKVAFDLCNKLGVGLKELTDRFKEAFQDEYSNIEMLVLNQSVSLPSKEKLEKVGERREVAYLFRYFKYVFYEINNIRITKHHELKFIHYHWCDNSNKIINIKNFYRWRVMEYEYTLESLPDYLYSKDIPLGSYKVIKPLWREEIYNRAFYGGDNEQRYFDYHFIHRLDKNTFQVVILSMGGRLADSTHDFIESWATPNGWSSYDPNQSDERGIFPISRKLLYGLTQKEKDELLITALQFSWVHKKTVKQYRSWVQPVVKIGAYIAAAVTFVYSAGTGASASAAMLKAATTYAAIYAVEKAIDYAVKVGWISPSTGAALKFVANIAAIAYGAGFDFSKLMTAPNIMKMVNASFDSYGKYKQYQMNQMMKSYEEHQAFQKQRSSELTKKQKELMELTEIPADAKLWLDAPSFKSKVDLFETPEMMYSRHYNSNVVNLSLSQVYNQSDLLLNNRINLSAKWVEPNLEVYEYVRWKNI